MITTNKYLLCVFLSFIIVHTASATGGKRIYINKNNQTLTAYEGDRVVLSSKISSGKSRSPTPNGSFQVGVMERMHRSRLYKNAPMPYSMQFSNHYFIHGFSSVPNYPASHGCVRMPIGNAQRLFNWATPGTPVTVGNKQSGARKKMAATTPRKVKVIKVKTVPKNQDDFETLE